MVRIPSQRDGKTISSVYYYKGYKYKRHSGYVKLVFVNLFTEAETINTHVIRIQYKRYNCYVTSVFMTLFSEAMIGSWLQHKLPVNSTVEAMFIPHQSG